jgi:hypothetical protein
MAKRPAVSAKSAAKTLRKRTGPTFIQRSRSVSSEEKAMYHQVLGAGRSRVLRPFLDINEADQQLLGDKLEDAVALRTGARKT